MLSILSDAALISHTKCAGRTIAPIGTICNVSVSLTTRMNPSTQAAQPWSSLYFVVITTAYSCSWEHNIHCWVFFHLLERFNNMFPMGRRSWNWRIWFGGVRLKYNTGKKGTRPMKVLSKSLSIYWTQMLWNSGMIPWLASVYSTLRSSPRCSTDVGQWNGWR